MYKITLSDGSVIDKLELNGNNYISNTEIKQATFNGKLSHVVIDGPESHEDHGPMKLVQISKHNNEWWFILTDLTKQEIWERKIMDILDTQDARTSYIEMMEGF